MIRRGASSMKMSKLETAIRVVIDFNKAFNGHDVPAMIGLVSDDCVFENPDPFAKAELYKGREELARFGERFFVLHPQATFEIDEIFGFSIHCVMRWSLDSEEIPGVRHRFQGVDLFQIKNALICEKLTYVKK